VGIGPLKFFNRSLHLDRLVGVEHGEGMMRQSGRHEQSGCDPGKAQNLEVHWALPERLF
jgi:hypothetical protein